MTTLIFSYLSNSFLVLSIALVGGSIIFGTLGYFVAASRRVAPWFGVVLGLMMGPFGLLILGLASTWYNWIASSRWTEEE